MNKNIYDILIDEELGALYKKDRTDFKVWSPTAEKVILNLYKKGSGDCLYKNFDMTKNDDGLWETSVCEDLNGLYYTYSITINKVTNEVVDIYAKAAGVNGMRGMIIDLNDTDPEGFRQTPRPVFSGINNAILYEVHVRDFSIDESSGITMKGKFLGFTETDTKNKNGQYTGLAHLKELGVTHVHLLPSFDYETVDEASNDPQYNWGYDPKNYNVPEGSYSTDAENGAVRINEFKQLVKSLHENGIRVVMDVVFNHTYKGNDSIFNLTVPDYYYRTEKGKFTNGSACGNETASDNLMMRKYIVDSVKYWAEEYMIDGFRFDLMGLHDVTTMNTISETLSKVDDSIIIYGEGWVADYTPLPESERAIKANAKRMPKIAFFNDDIRDTIKGSVFKEAGKGFVNGKSNLEENLKLCITGSIITDLIDTAKTDCKPWALSPSQVINYCEAHDNLTLWDKLFYSAKEYTIEEKIRMDKLCAAIVFLSQGVPFIQAGQEFLRSKPKDDTGKNFDEDSYKSPDRVNSIKWNRKSEYLDVFNYYKGLIELRKAFDLFRLSNAEDVKKYLSFIDCKDKNAVAFRLKNDKNDIIVVFNANREDIIFSLPEGEWNVIVNDKTAGKEVIGKAEKEVSISAISAMVLTK